MSSFKEATREAMNRCGETCPAVDSAFEDLITDITALVAPSLMGDMTVEINDCCERVKKEATTVLRDALVDARLDLLQAQSELADAEARIDRLELELAEVAA